MNQCVPSWDVEDPPNPPPSRIPSYAATHVPTLAKESRFDSEVAELTWENGYLSMHGLGHPRIGKPIPTYASAASPAAVAAAAATWHKPRPSGTLEAVVDQATRALLLIPSPTTPAAGTQHPEIAAFLRGSHRLCSPAPAVEALVVPCVGSCGGDGGRKRERGRAGGEGSRNYGSRRRGESTLLAETCEMFGSDEAGFTTTSATQSPVDGSGSWPDTEYTSLGGQSSPCHSRRSQNDGVGDEEEEEEEEEAEEKATKGGTRISSISTRRSKAAAVHNQSERKRRDRINQKMRTLQKLVPNSSKTDKASMLDEVIEYLKQLQAQIHMMSRMSNIPPMMMPMSMQHLQLSMMAQMAQMAQMQMGIGMGMMDMGSLGRPGLTGMPGVLPTASAFVPLAGASWDASHQPGGRGTVAPDPFLAACLSGHGQPMNIDAYNRMVALYQHLYQMTPPTNPKT